MNEGLGMVSAFFFGAELATLPLRLLLLELTLGLQ